MQVDRKSKRLEPGPSRSASSRLKIIKLIIKIISNDNYIKNTNLNCIKNNVNNDFNNEINSDNKNDNDDNSK